MGIGFKKFMRSLSADKRVAYLPLDGVILEQKLFESSPSLMEFFKDLEEQEVKALVVRINSPGGTVGASQELYRELRRLSSEKDIKVVASFGDVSASGGVYVAMAADYIYTQPGTVTGSIGVIIKSGNLKELLDKIGIRADVVKSGQYKDILSPDRAMTPEEKALLQTTIDDTYDQFVEVVASRRSRAVEEVKAFADGRIFSGRQAVELGLVDSLGGLHDAVQKARKLAGLSLEGPAKIIKHEKKRSFLQKLMHSDMRLDSVMPLRLLDQECKISGVPLWMMPNFPR